MLGAQREMPERTEAEPSVLLLRPQAPATPAAGTGVQTLLRAQHCAPSKCAVFCASGPRERSLLSSPLPELCALCPGHATGTQAQGF